MKPITPVIDMSNEAIYKSFCLHLNSLDDKRKSQIDDVIKALKTLLVSGNHDVDDPIDNYPTLRGYYDLAQIIESFEDDELEALHLETSILLRSRDS